jgi:acyl-CoA synthetase (AMP-forming)/AMP-acid ligase II
MTVSMGRTALLHSIVAGSSLISPPPPDLNDVWAAIEAERPTWMHTAAGFLELLVRWLRSHPALPAPTSLRFVRVTAAPISAEICDELARRLRAPILPGYSTSETGIIATALPPPAPFKPGSTGQPQQEIRIDAGGVDAPPGAVGEIWVRGPSVLSGYLNDPELDEAVITKDRWFRTGDVGYLDDEDFLFLTGRVKELINRGGTKIAPAETDAVLQAHPAVHAAAAFAVPDDRMGEDVVAAVVADDGAAPTPLALRSWMLERLAPHKVPRRVWLVDDLPRTTSGKVRRGELSRRWIAAHG